MMKGEQKDGDGDDQKAETMLPITQPENVEELPEKKNEEPTGENDTPSATSVALQTQPNLSEQDADSHPKNPQKTLDGGKG